MTVYNSNDVKRMNITSCACNKSRIQELINFAKLSGYKKLGIASCTSMKAYASCLQEILKEAGFEVFTRFCRDSGLTGKDICADFDGACCDPVSQADYLNENKTDFNINIGLCLGHGLIFQKYSKADVTTLVVKDFSTNHNVLNKLS